MTKNITDQELDALLREDASIMKSRPVGRAVDVTDAVMQRVGKMPYLLPSHNAAMRRRRRAVAAVAAMVLLCSTGAGFGQYQTKVANERLASMFSSVYAFDYCHSSSVCASEMEAGYLY